MSSNEELFEKLIGSGLGVSSFSPAFLEAIAMSLGHKRHGGETVADSLTRIGDSLERIANALEKRGD